MAAAWEVHLARWVEAFLIEPATAERIRVFEADQARRHGLRWPILLALAFGGILVGAGVFLFVSAHWDALSPSARMAAVLSLVGLFHIIGAVSASRFQGLAISLHALGTLALGAGIALAGQIFNLQEHWPTAILLWALGALAGWMLLRHWTQGALAALLFPAWIAGEWLLGTSMWQIPNSRPMAAGFWLLALTYLTARVMPGEYSREVALRNALSWIGGLALVPATLYAIYSAQHSTASATSATAALAWLVAIGAPLALAFTLRRRAALLNCAAAIWILLMGISRPSGDRPWIFIWCAAAAIGLVGWGVREARSELINLGIAGFAITVLVYYFSNVMDKLGRSASLMALGALFLAGGWALERLRRKLIAQMKTEAA